MFQYLINKIYQKELILLFGENSYVDVRSIRYSTNDKCYIIDVKLTIGIMNESELIDTYPDGLNYIIKEAWPYLGLGKTNLSIISTMT